MISKPLASIACDRVIISEHTTDFYGTDFSRLNHFDQISFQQTLKVNVRTSNKAEENRI